MPVIIRNYKSISWPKRAEYISAEELEKLVKAGEATKNMDGIYVTRQMKAGGVKAKPVQADEPETEAETAEAKEAPKKAPAKKRTKAADK